MNKYKTFKAWMQAVDEAIIASVGLGYMDLPDCCFHDWFDDGYTVREAARLAIKNANE